MWAELPWQAWLTLATLAGVLFLLLTDRVSSDVATLGGLGLLIVTGVVDLKSALAGFSNAGVLTIALLFVVASLLEKSGGLAFLSRHILVKTASLPFGLLRMMVPTALLSAFLNNTPIVAMLLPATKSWAEQNGFSPTKVLIPLSYASIVGGTCTLIGTSTNLVVVGLLEDAGLPSIGFFDLGLIGVPLAVIGIAYLTLVGWRILPDRRESDDAFTDPATFTSEVIVRPGSSLVGRALSDAHIGGLRGLYPVEVRRQGTILPAPQPDLVLDEGDRLVLAGAAAQMTNLYTGTELAVPDERKYELGEEWQRGIVEVVLSDSCPLIGHTVGDGTFRRHYGAAVVAVSRYGDRVPSHNIDDWKLRVGDRLLLEASDGFEHHKSSRDFFIVNEWYETPKPPSSPAVAVASLLVVAAMVVAAGLQLVSLFVAAISAVAGLFVINRPSGSDLRGSIDWQVVLTIAAAFGIAEAMAGTGVAGAIASSLLTLGSGHPWVSLAVVYFATWILTELITNNAAAALAFPFAMAVAAALGVSPIPYAISIMIAASSSFTTPLGYQTNLMVFGAGDYRFSDFVRVGLPMNLIAAGVAIGLTPLFFPF